MEKYLFIAIVSTLLAACESDNTKQQNESKQSESTTIKQEQENTSETLTTEAEIKLEDKITEPPEHNDLCKDNNLAKKKSAKPQADQTLILLESAADIESTTQQQEAVIGDLYLGDGEAFTITENFHQFANIYLGPGSTINISDTANEQYDEITLRSDANCDLQGELLFPNYTGKVTINCEETIYLNGTLTGKSAVFIFQGHHFVIDEIDSEESGAYLIEGDGRSNTLTFNNSDTTVNLGEKCPNPAAGSTGADLSSNEWITCISNVETISSTYSGTLIGVDNGANWTITPTNDTTLVNNSTGTITSTGGNISLDNSFEVNTLVQEIQAGGIDTFNLGDGITLEPSIIEGQQGEITIDKPTTEAGASKISCL